MNATIYNLQTGEARTLPEDQARHLTHMQRGEWTFTKLLPAGWDREIPKYRATRDLTPNLGSSCLESPFAYQSDPDLYQYGMAPIARAEIVETTSWPHGSFAPINETAKRIHAFFQGRQKSRMQRSPWRNGRMCIDDGMSFDKIAVLPPQLQPVTPANVRRA